MADFPFGNPNLGDELLKAWQRSLDAWWKTLLTDPTRLADLAQRLGSSPGPEAVKLLEALELLEKRVGEVEQRLDALTENLSSVVAYLEKL